MLVAGGMRLSICFMAHYTSDATVMDDYWAEYPNLTQTEVRNALGAFLFTGDDVFKQVSMLSGGERVRLALCKILKKKPNLLILDEPTNHMDIVGKEALEQMLKGYQGTLVFVSHKAILVNKSENYFAIPFEYIKANDNGIEQIKAGAIAFEIKDKKISIVKKYSTEIENTNPVRSTIVDNVIYTFSDGEFINSFMAK